MYSSSNRQREMDYEKSLNLRDYYFIFRTYYKLIVAMAILGFCIAFYSILTLPPKYTATSSVAIREKPGASMIMDLTGNRDRNRMSNEIQLIKSRSVAKETIEWLKSPERLKGQKDDLRSLRGKPGAINAMSKMIINLLPKSILGSQIE